MTTPIYNDQKMVIYKITNTTNNKSYIGKTVSGIAERLYRHKYDARKKLSDTHFARALRKYPDTCWTAEVIYVAFDRDVLSDIEKILIAEHDTVNSGYNMTAGGDGGWEYVNSIPDIVDKKRATWDKRTKEDNTVYARPGKHNGMYGTCRTGKDNPNYGKSHTDEVKDKIRIANTGRVKSTESIDKQRDSMRKTLDKMDIHYNAKSVKFIYNNEIVIVVNLARYCRDNNLSEGCMRSVIAGRQNKHKGYVLYNG